MTAVDRASSDPALVEKLAALPKASGDGVERRFRSFASKFAHFFVDSKRFPIFDKYAVQMVAFHLGDAVVNDPKREYVAYHTNFFRLKAAADLDRLPNRDLDRYLWLAGQHATLLKNPAANVNSEVKRLLTSLDPITKRLIQRMVLDGRAR